MAGRCFLGRSIAGSWENLSMLLFQVIPRTECVDIAALTEDLVQRGTSDMEALGGLRF